MKTEKNVIIEINEDDLVDAAARFMNAWQDDAYVSREHVRIDFSARKAVAKVLMITDDDADDEDE